MFSPLEQFSFIPVAYWGLWDPDEGYWQAWWNDYGFCQFIIPFLLVRFYFYFFFDDEDYYHLIPRAPQRIFEMKAIFVFNLIKQQLGSEHYDYFVIVYTVFFGILYLNLMSLLPFGVAVTSQIQLMLFISLFISMGFFLKGLVVRGWDFFWVFLPSCPVFMMPFLILIEAFSYIIRSFSLAIRLSANITAGHTLVYIISSFLLKAVFTNYFFFIIGLCLLSAIWVLEIGVAFLQAYVFTILMLIYLNDSIKSGRH